MTTTMTVAEYQAEVAKQKKPKKTKQEESRIKRQIRDYLQFQGWEVRYIIQSALSEPGLPDLFCFKAGRIVFVEVKTPTGRLSDHQKAFQAACEREGVPYMVARSIEDMTGLGNEHQPALWGKP